MELQENFGPFNATSAAEGKLENLRMSDNQKITKYIANFTRLATQVPWGENALRYQFYKGLPPRIKDRIAEVGKPESLVKLRELAQSLDHRYWERKTEQSRKTGGQKTNTKSTSSDGKAARTDSGSGSGSADNKPRTSGSNTSKDRSAKPYADKLGQDGKLTKEERQRRFDKNLCLFCGNAGHTAADCPKKTSPGTKARAAKATSETPDAAATEVASVSSETKN